jgi:hypothetical protein
MRVVLYAEGAGDAPTAGLPPHPDAELQDEHLGPAHHLVRRCLCEGTRVPVAAVRFRAPLRHRGRIAVGSDLLHPKILRRLLTWPRVDARPNLAVVLVDEDGDTGRRSRLEATVEGLPVQVVVGVAVRELEAWLLADTAAVRTATQRDVAAPPSVEGLEPGEAKRRLAVATDGAQTFAKRMAIAQTADLGRLRKLHAFERFHKRLQAAALGALRNASR